MVHTDGWFKSKHFLLPIGLARADAGGQGIVAEGLTRDRIKHFPGFDRDAFEKFGPDDLKSLNDDTSRACSLTAIAVSVDEPYSAA